MPYHHHLLPRRLLVTPFMSPTNPTSPSLIHNGIFFSFAAVVLAAGFYYLFDCLCGRLFRRQQSQPPPDCRDSEREDLFLIELQTIPLKVYRAPSWQPDGGDGGREAENCPVCLGEYVAGEELRVLPICRHEFHRECIDRWLIIKSSSFSSSSFSSSSTSCPVCRGSIVDLEMAAAAVAGEETNVSV